MAGRDLRGLSPTIQTLVTEAAGEGREGMKRVAKVILTRSAQRNLTPDQVVQEPKQFSGWERPDRGAFLAKQPDETFRSAAQAMKDAQSEMKDGKPWATNYLKKSLYESSTRPSWANKMKVIEQYGNHVFLSE